MASICATVSHRATAHGGVPCGAVVVELAQAQQFRIALEQAVGEGRLRLPADRYGGLLLYVRPPAAAHVFEAEQHRLTPELEGLLASGACRYLSGVRRYERALGRPPPLLCRPPPASCRFTFAEVFAPLIQNMPPTALVRNAGPFRGHLLQ